MQAPWLLHLYVCAGEVLLGLLTIVGIALQSPTFFYIYGDLRFLLYGALLFAGVVQLGLSSLLLWGLGTRWAPLTALLVAHGLPPVVSALILFGLFLVFIVYVV